MDNIIFSIITPLFNQEERIKRCIESVSYQSYGFFEHIIIDDGSTDNSYTVAKKYAEQDNRIKLYTQKNKGSSNAYNRGLDLASGDYIIILDNDDWLDKNTLQILFDYINKYDNPDVVQMNFIFHEENNLDVIQQYSLANKPIFYRNKNEIEEKIEKNNRVFIKTNTRKAIKKDLYSDVRYEGCAFGADAIVMSKITLSCNSLLFIPHYLVHVEEIRHSQSRRSLSVADMICIMKRHIVFLQYLSSTQKKDIPYIETYDFYEYYKVFALRINTNRDNSEYSKQTKLYGKKLWKYRKFLIEYRELNWVRRLLFALFVKNPFFYSFLKRIIPWHRNLE